VSTPEIIIHRVNERARLVSIPRHFGAEIDLRAEGSTLVLHHDPFRGGERFADWLEAYEHGILVLNIKEAGIEAEAIRLVESRGVRRFFLLDVEFPYLYRASRAGERRIAVRYSEDEPVATAELYRDRVDWVWIDTNTRLPVQADTAEHLGKLRRCLVCPERWGRPQDIRPYRQRLATLEFTLDAVMTSPVHVGDWLAPLS
jgi:hypothetical protein